MNNHEVFKKIVSANLGDFFKGIDSKKWINI